MNRDDSFGRIRYVGSFQRGKVIRTGEPKVAVWKQVERFGTRDSLARVATRRGHDPALAAVASLRIQQALELHAAATTASTLTRPLMLYYCALNLTRAVMLTYLGAIGAARHGLVYRRADALLDCSATVTADGTYPRFAKSINPAFEQEIADRTFTLKEALASIPEMHGDFPLLNVGPPSTVVVTVEAYIRGEMFLKFFQPGVTVEEFAAQWQTLFPWFADLCELVADSSFTLRVRETPKSEAEISAFCEKWLLPDMCLRQNAVWQDHIVRNENGPKPLIPLIAYIGALFILSNVCRYEPELLGPAREYNDLGYVLGTFLDNADRYFPQLMLKLLEGRMVYFE